MKPHVRNYYKALRYDISDFILCELCGLIAVEIHHVKPRSLLGTDEVNNLVALCRECHDKAHGPMASVYKVKFKQIISKR